MRNITSENVAEHSLQVAILAHALAVISREIFGKDIEPDRAAVLALFHDTPEIMTGDLPTPVKYFNADIAAAYRQLEDRTVKKMLSMLPDELMPVYQAVYDQQTGPLYDIVKAADKLAAYIKCAEECASGNSDFKKAHEATKAAVYASDLPEVKYFLDNFMDAFALTLDEI